MILGMTSLECFGTLSFPTTTLWDYLRQRNITSNSLQYLRVVFDYDVGLLEALVQALPTFAPSLRTLFVENSLTDLCSSIGEEDVIGTLSTLRHHPTLKQIQ